MLVTKVIMPEEKYSIKCPYEMKPEGISVHNTANDASAMSEVSYMIKNNMKVSFHEAIDDYRVVIGVDHNRNTWNASDGHGFGNMKTISIEICYSESGGERFIKAEQNAAERIAYLMKEYGWNLNNIIDERHTIGTHQQRSGKYCPHRTLDMGLERFWDMVRAEYRELTGENVGGTPVIKVDENVNNTSRKVGDIVTINGVYTSSSSSRKLNPSVKTGMITRIISGAKNPYLLDNGNIGWANDNCIISSENSEVTPVSNPSTPNISKGAIVTLSDNATHYATGQAIPNRFKNRNYTILQVGNGRVLLKELYSWVKVEDLVGYKFDNSQETEPVLRTLARNTNLRNEPTTASSKKTLYIANTTLYILEENVANANGFIWDKVKIRANGQIGYMINKNYK